MSEHVKFMIRCRAIIFHDGKLLVVRHNRDSSFVALPGGHLEQGEDVKECLRREIVEELGIEPEIGRLLYIHTFQDLNNKQDVEFFYEIRNSEKYLDCKNLSGSHTFEIADIFWMSPTDDVQILPKKIAEDFRAGKLLSDEVKYIKELNN
ncbi:MAG: NUDIX hydrolase [bacterium]